MDYVYLIVLGEKKNDDTEMEETHTFISDIKWEQNKQAAMKREGT